MTSWGVAAVIGFYVVSLLQCLMAMRSMRQSIEVLKEATALARLAEARTKMLHEAMELFGYGARNEALALVKRAWS